MGSIRWNGDDILRGFPGMGWEKYLGNGANALPFWYSVIFSRMYSNLSGETKENIEQPPSGWSTAELESAYIVTTDPRYYGLDHGDWVTHTCTRRVN